MRGWTAGWLLLLLLLVFSAACGGDNEVGEVTPVDVGASPSAYFQGLEGVDQGEPDSDDAQQHSEFHRLRVDTFVAVRTDLAQSNPPRRQPSYTLLSSLGCNVRSTSKDG